MSVSQSLTLTEVSHNNTANTSQVRILWASTQTGDSWNGYTRTAKYYVSINGGAEKEYSVSYTLPQNATKTIVDATITVTHKSDGSGSVSVRTWMDTGISAGIVTKTQSLTLTTIPRASTIDYLSCATKYFTGKLTYKYTPKNSGFYNRCNISIKIDEEYIAVKSVYLGKQSASQKTATVTFVEDELSTIYNELPKTTKGTLRFTFRTYSDSGYSTQIGDASYKEISLNIPDIDATKPTVTMTLSPVTSLDSPFNALYIKGRSKVKASFSNGEGKYGADIVSYEMRVNGKSYGSPYTSGYLSSSGSVTVKGIVTDSRGFSREYEQSITVISYDGPKILPASDESGIVCARCDGDGNLTESGTWLKIKAKRSYSTVTSDGDQNNFCSIRYRFVPEGSKFTGDEGWVTLLEGSDTSTDSVNETLSGVVSSAEKAYVVQVGVIDSIGESNAVQFMIPTDFITIDVPEKHNGKKIGMFRYAPDTGEDGLYLGMPIFGVYEDCVTETGVSYIDDNDTNKGYWRYRKWKSGALDMSGFIQVFPTTDTAQGTEKGYWSSLIEVDLPFSVETFQYTGASASNFILFANASMNGDNKIRFRLFRFSDYGSLSESGVYIRIMANGKYK